MATPELKRGVDVFTLVELLRKAAEYKGLKLQEGGSGAYSEPIKVYTLDDKLLAILSEHGIKRQPRPDCRDEVFTLVDENPQGPKISGWAYSNYWNFKLTEGDNRVFNLQVSLSVGFRSNHEKRGFELVPQAHGTFLSPSDNLPNFRMFKVLVDSDKKAPAVAKELAASDGNIVVTWTDIGLGGLRRLADLFFEFSAGKESVEGLGRLGRIFNPLPFPNNEQPGDRLFVAEPAQPRIFQAWREQLKKYRDSLIV